MLFEKNRDTGSFLLPKIRKEGKGLITEGGGLIFIEEYKCLWYDERVYALPSRVAGREDKRERQIRIVEV